jgi:arylsulfatase A-like enzyme
MPDLFKVAGYNTAVIGKWHLGLMEGKKDWNKAIKPGPLEIGFDYCFLLPYTNDRVPCVYVENHHVVNLDPKDPLYVGSKPGGFKGTEYPNARQNPEAMTYYKSSRGHNETVINGIGRIGQMYGGESALWNDETMADEFIKRTDDWLAKQTKDKPFFLFFSSQDIHVPRAPHPRFHGKTECGFRGDAMVQFDWSVGAITAALEKYGFADNTVIIFSSDNGPVYDDGYKDGSTVKVMSKEVDNGHDASGPYRGGKYNIWEGGTRVPLIIKWPGKIKPGTTSKALVSQIDLMASFAKLFEIELKPEQGKDSRDTLSAFIGEDPDGLPFLIEETKRVDALRQGDWKFILKKKALYNLAEDIREQNNVWNKHPEKVKQLTDLYRRTKNKAGLRNLK